MFCCSASAGFANVWLSLCVCRHVGEPQTDAEVLESTLKSIDDDAKDEGTWLKFRWYVGRLVQQNWFEAVLLLAVFFNGVTLAMEHTTTTTINGVEQAQKMDAALEDTLDILNIVFLSFFTIEMSLCLIAYSWSYFTEAMSWLDIVVVLFGWIEVSSIRECCFCVNTALSGCYSR